MKLMPLRSRAIFLPSSFISRGKVTIPTIVNVVMKAATAVTDAPPLRSDAAKGKEIRAGICRIAPKNAIIITPPKPACSPITSETLVGGTKPKSTPMTIMIVKTIGRMRKKDFTATISDRFVFALFLVKETSKQTKANTFINKAVLFIIQYLTAF